MRYSALAVVATALMAASCGGTSEGRRSTQEGGTGGVSGAGDGGSTTSGGSLSGGTGGAPSGGTGGPTPIGGTGGDIQCPPCVAPPRPDCVGTGPCGCGPYVCPEPCEGLACGEPCSTCVDDVCLGVEEYCNEAGECTHEIPDCIGGMGGTGGTTTTEPCTAVSGDYGDCQVALGWAFDGRSCQSYSGCSCEPDCDYFFGTATECALACRAAGYCNPDALVGGGINTAFEIGSFCDDVLVCAPAGAEATIDEALPGTTCDPLSTQCPDGVTCMTQLRGDVTDAEWDQVCAVSLLPQVGLMCWVWGP